MAGQSSFHKNSLTFGFAILAVALVWPLSLIAKPLPPASSQTSSKNSNKATSLPAKKKTPTKTTRIDFSENDGVVIAPRNSALNKAINKAEAQQRTQEVQVRSRLVVPAPPGDQAEILSSAPATKAAPAVTIAATPAPTPAPIPAATPAPVAQVTLPPRPTPEPVVAVTPPPTFELLNVEEKPPVEIAKPMAPASPQATVVTSEKTLTARTPPANGPSSTLAFFRTGYLHAHYKKFDDRMKDGATSIGLGAARGFETAWGEFEARASLDIYHAMDQSVTVDHVRMFATRTEVAYWITKARVRPALTFGLGWADYAVKSYRAVKTDGQGEVVTLRTHAKSQAFTVIPGTALRIQLNDEIVIDTQTEFLGLLGGDSADAVQGLAFGISLGWIF